MTYVGTQRKGVTLVELLIFIAVIAVVGASLIPLLFSSTESRLLQESISLVETNGSQIMQVLGKKIRESDHVISPAPGQTGKILALQLPTEAGTPTVFGILTGALLMIQHTTSQTISASEVSLESFTVRNTGNGTSTGVYVTFTVSRTIRLRAPRMYRQTFQTFISLYPKNIVRDCPCELTAPVCGVGGQQLSWFVSGNDCTTCVQTTPPFQMICQ
jgi:type II secretory pathway pseudopilin PulG